MRVKILPLLVSLFILPVAADAFADIASDWHAFVVSQEPDAASPANLAPLVLDGPAGKHGFVTARNGRLVFEDGTPARFWGTNLTFSACFPNKKDARLLADRLAFFGFNAVRLHHMDFQFEPHGIFKDTRERHPRLQAKSTGRLSQAQLDRLDYLVYQLKLRGIYVDMNLLVSRHFTRLDGAEEAEDMGLAAKPVSMFNRRLIELQKQYARDLLTHKSRYTGLTYVEEPAVALVEITNENSFFQWWEWGWLDKKGSGRKKGAFPDVYLDELDGLWRIWLETKYGPGDPRGLEARPVYKRKDSYPPQLISDFEAFFIELEKRYVDEMSSFLKKDLGIRVPVTGLGGPQDAKEIAAQASSDFLDEHTYWDHPKFPGKSWNTGRFRIHNQSMLRSPALGMIGALRNKNVTGKPRTLTEWNHCAPNRYAYETPAAMAAEAARNGWDALFQFAYAQKSPSRSSPGRIDDFVEIASNPQQLLLNAAASLIFFEKNPGASFDKGIYRIESPRVAGAAGFIKGRPVAAGALSVTAGADGAIFLYAADGGTLENSKKMVLMTVGEIRNTNSRWKGLETFDWGKAPTLLRRMHAVVTADAGRPVRIFALTEAGTRGDEITPQTRGGKLVYDLRGADSPWFEVTA